MVPSEKIKTDSIGENPQTAGGAGPVTPMPHDTRLRLAMPHIGPAGRDVMEIITVFLMDPGRRYRGNGGWGIGKSGPLRTVRMKT